MIAILTSSLKAPGAIALVKAFRSFGYDAKRYLINNPNVNHIVRKSDYVVFRIGPNSFKGFDKLNDEINDTALTKNLLAFDKIKTYKTLLENNIPMPVTEILGKHDMLKKLKLPVVLKVPCGNQGKGVELASTKEEFIEIKRQFLEYNNEIIAQEYIAESKGSDVRIIVAAGKVIAAMSRCNDRDFRANLHMGGEAKAYDPSDEEKIIAIDSVAALGLDFAGVDILHSNRGSLVLEVNPSPGFGISEIVGFNVAEKIVEQLKKEGKI
jgi:alpha-L-glutamate ligases, RimK family